MIPKLLIVMERETTFCIGTFSNFPSQNYFNKSFHN